MYFKSNQQNYFKKDIYTEIGQSYCFLITTLSELSLFRLALLQPLVEDVSHKKLKEV